MKRIALALWLVLTPSLLFAQAELKTGVRLLVENASQIDKVGDALLVDSSEPLKTKPVGVIVVRTEAANVEVEATDINRMPTEARRLDPSTWIVEAAGKYWIDVTVFDAPKNIFAKRKAILEIGVGPGPKPPPPPGPGPTPPTPSQVLIDGKGLHVLLVYESAEASKLTAAQQQILFGQTIRSFLSQNCAKGADGSSEFRVLDQDTRYSDAGNKWAKALTRARSSVPWVIVSKDGAGYEGPLPATEEEFVLLVDSYLGTRTVQGGTRIVMHTTTDCVWCRVFREVEAPKLRLPMTVVNGKASIFPSFELQHNGKVKLLEGYKTARQLEEEIKQMGATL